MKKKSNLILLSLIILAVIMGVMVSSMNDVYAENNPKGECGVNYMNDKYLENIDISVSGSIATLTNNTGANLYYTTTSNSELQNFNATTSVNIELITGTEEITFYLQQADEKCSDYDITNSIGNVTVNEGAKVNSLYNNELCVTYRNKWSSNTTMKNAIPYCFSEKVEEEYDYQTVASWITAAEEAYAGANKNTTITEDPNTNVDNVTDVQKLTCHMFSTNNYETMRKYSHVETTTENSCQVTCREDVEVNFSDPIATQAGMCFEYLIEIKSKVVCEAQYTAPIPTAKPVCVPHAVCKAGNYEGDAGGPNEEFDSCINSCDNGEYTQECIDKCYNEVYESDSTSTKQTTTTTKKNKILTLESTTNSFIDATKTAYTTDSKGCIVASTVDYNNAAEIRALYEQQQLRTGGSYVTKDNGEVVWQPNSTGCNTNIGHYYFKNLETTKKTVGMLRGLIAYGRNNDHYEPDGFGILRAVKTNNAICSDTCEWVNDCGSNTALTSSYTFNGNTYATFEEAMAAYNAAKASCESKAATCNNETTEYKMVVDNLDENDSENDKDKSDWQKSFTSEQKLNSTNISGKFPSMVTYAGGTCELGKGTCEEKDQVVAGETTNCWNYHNIITFPGSWINNKTGQTVHSIQKGKEDYYTYIGNEYCTKLDSKTVNKAWYNWKVNQSTSLTEKEIKDKTDYNITGEITNYGYFGWNFDIKCFYALVKDPEECTADSCDVDEGSKKIENAVNNYKFRAVSLDNLFPSSEAGTTTREAGFNWNCNGTNLENENYIVEPVALINDIQDLGDSIYENDDYLDYSIHLTPETMKEIRRYNDKNKTYDQSGDESAGSKKTAGITVYKSELLTDLGSSVVKKRGLIGCNNETNGQCINTVTNNTCSNLYQAESTVLKGGNS